MNARIVLAVCGCLLAGVVVAGSTGKVTAQSTAPVPPVHVTRIPAASTAGAIWGDDQNVFVLVGDRLFKVRKYDMKIDGTVALRVGGTTGSAAQKIRRATHPRVQPDEE
jgi:hypothetical protein